MRNQSYASYSFNHNSTPPFLWNNEEMAKGTSLGYDSTDCYVVYHILQVILVQ